MRLRGTSLVSAIALCALSALAVRAQPAAPGAAGGAFSDGTRPAARPPASYAASLEPAAPRAGEPFVLALMVADLPGAEPGDIVLGKGLRLVASSSRPRVDRATGRRGLEIRVELLAGQPGVYVLERIALAAQGEIHALGPFTINVAGDPPAGQAPSWRWSAPSRAYRYEAFGLSLEPPSWLEPLGASASFASPPGASVEQGESPLSWVCVALEPGRLKLPSVRVEGPPGAAGGGFGQAAASFVEILPLPERAAATRAIGDFTLRLEGPSGGGFRQGDTLAFRLVLSGEGNHPAALFPGLAASLDGKPLSKELLALRRVDAVRVGARGYEGTSILEVSLFAPGPGRLRLAAESFPVLGRDGSIRTLEADPVDLVIGASAPPETAAAPAPEDAFLGAALALARRAAAAEPAAAELPSCLAAGSGGKAASLRLKKGLAILAALPGSALDPGEAALLEAALRWQAGEGGAALARIYGASRQRPFDRDLRLAAEAAARRAGAGPIRRDSLPPPPLPALGAALFCLPGAGLVLAGRRSRRGFRTARAGRGAGGAGADGRDRPVLRAVGVLCLVAGLFLVALAGAGALERKRDYAVVWTNRLLAVPSAKAAEGSPIDRGRSGRVMGAAPAYVGVEFDDGGMGWAPVGDVYFY